MKAYAIKTRSMGVDENGVQKVVWATKSQVEEIKRRMNNSDLRGSAVTIGGSSFPVNEVVLIEEREKPAYDLPRYYLDRYKKENDPPALQDKERVAIDEAIVFTPAIPPGVDTQPDPSKPNFHYDPKMRYKWDRTSKRMVLIGEKQDDQEN